MKKKIIFELSQEMHTDIKVLAARHNVSMTLLIHRALIEYIKRETKYDKGNMSK
jgi:predicted transcriptional regulator